MKAMIKEYSIVTIGTLIVATGVFFFMLPSNVVAGSLTGLVMVLTNFIPIKISVLTFILNAFLLVIGFIFIGKEFGGKTVYASVLLPIFLGIFELGIDGGCDDPALISKGGCTDCAEKRISCYLIARCRV